jgi:hypothetical protein
MSQAHRARSITYVVLCVALHQLALAPVVLVVLHDRGLAQVMDKGNQSTQIRIYSLQKNRIYGGWLHKKSVIIQTLKVVLHTLLPEKKMYF